jgi:hypothetical protein
VALSFEEEKFTEVLVDGDEDASFCCRLPQERFISRIFIQFARIQDFVTLFAKPLGHPPACASIDEEPQRLATRTASRDSSATTA